MRGYVDGRIEGAELLLVPSGVPSRPIEIRRGQPGLGEALDAALASSPARPASGIWWARWNETRARSSFAIGSIDDVRREIAATEDLVAGYEAQVADGEDSAASARALVLNRELAAIAGGLLRMRKKPPKAGKRIPAALTGARGKWVRNPRTRRVAGKVVGISRRHGELLVENRLGCLVRLSPDTINRAGYALVGRRPPDDWAWLPLNQPRS